MIPIFYIKEQGQRGLPLSPAPQIPADPASASLRTISLDDSEHLLHNHHTSVVSLRLLFTFTPECRSPSLRNPMFAFTGIPTQSDVPPVALNQARNANWLLASRELPPSSGPPRDCQGFRTGEDGSNTPKNAPSASPGNNLALLTERAPPKLKSPRAPSLNCSDITLLSSQRISLSRPHPASA